MKNKSTFKTLLSLILGGALTLCPVFLQAQDEGEDMTSRIVNPSFEGGQKQVPIGPLIENLGDRNIPDGWTLNKALGGWNGLKVIANQATNPPYEGLQHFDLWKSKVVNTDFSQTIAKLPAGKYKLTAAIKIPSDNVELITDQHIYAKADIDGISYKGYVTEAGVGAENWEIKTILFSLSTEQDLIIGGAATNPNPVEGVFAGWFAVDDYRLFRIGDAEPLKLEDVLNAINEKQDEFSQFSNDNMPGGTYDALSKASQTAGDLGENPSLEEAQLVLKNFAQAVKDAKEGELLYDTLYLYINKSLDVPDDFPGYAEFRAVFTEKYNVFNNFESTNVEFREAVNSLRKAYEKINLDNMNLATQDESRDASWLIVNPKFTKAGSDISNQLAATTEGWTFNVSYATWVGMGLSYVGPEENEKVNAYSYNGWDHRYVETCQELQNLPEGTYTLSVDLNMISNPEESWIYMNTKYEEMIQKPSSQYNSEADPPTPFWETVTTPKAYVGKDGYLKIGFYCKNPTGWNHIGVNMTNFKLNYHGKEGSADKLVAELLIEAKALRDSVEIEEMIMPVEKAALLAIIEQAESAEDKNKVLEPLKEAIANVKESVTLYPEVEKALSVATDHFAVGQNMAEAEDNREFEELINDQLILLEASTTSRLDLASIKETLHNGTVRYQFKLTKQASVNNPVNVTIAILNPGIDKIVDSKPEGWECTRNTNGNFTNSGEHYSGDRSNTYIDANYGTPGALKFTARQTLVVPNGTYTLQCAGRSNGNGIYLFANTEEFYAEAFETSGNVGGSIWTKAADGSPEKEVNGSQGYGWSLAIISDIVVTNRSIEIGFTSDPEVSKGEPWTEGSWLSADDFVLKCTSGEGLVGIEDVNEDANDLLTSVYVENSFIKVKGCDEYTITNLSGNLIPRDTQLIPGFYLVTVKGESVKVIVK